MLTEAVGEDKVAQWEGLPDVERYQALLSDFFWGSKETSSQYNTIQSLCGTRSHNNNNNNNHCAVPVATTTTTTTTIIVRYP